LKVEKAKVDPSARALDGEAYARNEDGHKEEYGADGDGTAVAAEELKGQDEGNGAAGQSKRKPEALPQ
jgi:hypothetical protein